MQGLRVYQGFERAGYLDLQGLGSPEPPKLPIDSLLQEQEQELLALLQHKQSMKSRGDKPLLLLHKLDLSC